MNHDTSFNGSSTPLTPTVDDDPNQGKGHFALNLAFNGEGEAFIQPINTEKIYNAPLTKPLQTDSSSKFPTNKWLACRAILSGCILAAVIILMYFWLQIIYINPSFVEIFKLRPLTTETPKPSYMKLIAPLKSEWKVEYDIPNGIPLVVMNAEEMKNTQEINCPPSMFALALHVDSNSALAAEWLKICGKNVAYFRIDGNPSSTDVERLVNYVANAQHLGLKATLTVEKGEDILDNVDFQNMLTSDEVIKSVEISGYATPKTIESLVEAVPYAEELTIKGDNICKSLQRSLKSSEQSCEIAWSELQKLHIVETQDCRGMYDLIYSCWKMPNIKILQIRKSIISNPNANYIRSILDHYRILNVDFADNVCFGDTMQDYPFLCQPSAEA